jgi:hypothetical protein
MAVERMETCDDVGELARELGVGPRCLYSKRQRNPPFFLEGSVLKLKDE